MLRFSRLLALPFILALLYLIYVLFVLERDEYSIWLIPVVVILTVIFIFSPQIEWWASKRFPVRISPFLQKLFFKYSDYYRNMSDEQREQFDKRLWLAMRQKDWIGMKTGPVGEDIKAIVMAPWVWMTFHQDDYLPSHYERIVLYKHPFPSPRFNQWHSSETHHEDGVLIFSIEQLLPSFTQPHRFYNIALHEWAGVYLRQHNSDHLPTWNWEELDLLSPYGKEEIEAWLGLPVDDLQQVAIHHFFTFPAKMRHYFPDRFDILRNFFGIKS